MPCGPRPCSVLHKKGRECHVGDESQKLPIVSKARRAINVAVPYNYLLIESRGNLGSGTESGTNLTIRSSWHNYSHQNDFMMMEAQAFLAPLLPSACCQ